MATKYTPLTTQTPMAVANTKGIDDMIGVINSLLEYHKTKADTQWQNQQRDYQSGQQKLTLQNQAKEAETRQTYEAMLTKPKSFTQQDVMSLASTGTLNQSEINRLMPLSSDYVDQTDAMINFSAKLPELQTLDDFSAAVKATGLDKNTAFRMWNEQQQMDKMTAAAAKGAGKAGGGGQGGEPKLLAGQAEGVNIKKSFRKEGVNLDGYKVYVAGNDASPRMRLNGSDGKAYRFDGTKYYRSKSGKGDDWKEIDKDKVPTPEMKSLNKAMEMWQGAGWNAMGKSTSNYESRFSPNGN